MTRDTKDIAITLLLGGVSILMGLLQFHVPGVEGAVTDLREIPLLVAIFHISRSFYIFPLALLTALTSFIIPNTSYISTALMHVVGLGVAWYAFQYVKSWAISGLTRGLVWMGFVLIYYLVFLIPVLLLSEILIIGQDIPFWASMWEIDEVYMYEMLPTALVVGLYLIQWESRQALQETNTNLEQLVLDRTRELVDANHELQMLNEELTSSNEEIASLNENLEAIVADRTERINRQLEQLRHYAHANAHEVRGPLARILGLMYVIKQESDWQTKQELLELVQLSATELDEVIRKINRLLEHDE
ncbi:hypothetical protein QWY31_10115 [Cytophagales bacterium LB-30]|uniref:Signal transduction histidine kinase dimerisation/phosphoacceptor domain-containing protein n=1 Tax=Shiella aurantiaca TaxID=3058365 RepID=A0ABT8F644_9BACT|nr:hypothetical protein [Shiella aurantiaca]MDN4165860.1 hypothetical protein [Shiella aurantiaca]